MIVNRYLKSLIYLSRKFNEHVEIDLNDKHGFYIICIDNVSFKEEKTGEIKMIEGSGFTVDDAAYDYFRKAKNGGKLVHVSTNHEEEVI